MFQVFQSAGGARRIGGAAMTFPAKTVQDESLFLQLSKSVSCAPLPGQSQSARVSSGRASVAIVGNRSHGRDKRLVTITVSPILMDCSLLGTPQAKRSCG